MRDRNRLALRADAPGVHTLLCPTGDPPEAGDEPEAKPVFDLTSGVFMKLVRAMRDEAALPGGRVLEAAPRLLIGGADAPREPPAAGAPSGLLAKIETGADFFRTRFCFALAMLRRHLARLGDFGIPARVPILVGIGPLRSARAARWMNANLHGVHIPDSVVRRLDRAGDARAGGIRICVELLEARRGIEEVAGAHLMAPHGERAITEAIAGSGLRP